MKVITICGSLKFKDEMLLIAEKLSLEGNCVLTPIFPVSNDKEFTSEQLNNFKDEHLKRIELADAIFVVNKNNYIGDSTLREIYYAKSLKKDILYLE